MAAAVTMKKARFLADGIEYVDVLVRTSGNVAVVKRNGRVALTKSGVLAVGPAALTSTLVTRQIAFDDGTVWEVTGRRDGGCGCGK